MKLIQTQEKNIKNSALNSENGYSTSETHAMQRAVLNLFDKWQITKEQASILLGGISEKTLQRWQNGSYGRISIDQADRMSNLLAIHKSLRILFSDLNRVYDWIKRENDIFSGKSALDIMLQGHLSDIEDIRNYLDSVRGGW